MQIRINGMVILMIFMSMISGIATVILLVTPASNPTIHDIAISINATNCAIALITGIIFTQLKV